MCFSNLTRDLNLPTGFQVSTKPKVLCVGQPSLGDASLLDHLGDEYEVVHVYTRLRAFAQLARQKFAAIYIFPSEETDGLALAKWTQSERILDSMPDGVALLNNDNVIVWANECFTTWSDQGELTGLEFLAAFSGAKFVGPDYSPFATAKRTGKAAGSLLGCDNEVFYHVHAAPVQEEDGHSKFLIVTVRDVTTQTRQQRKLAAIHHAGLQLSELAPEEVYEMQIDDRIELLKQNILHHTKDLLQYDVVEIRLMDQKTGKLEPLLSSGMIEGSADLDLYALPEGNGVTGFVAATGRSYLCEDTEADPLYIQGCEGAKSSMTVPLIQHDQVIGTFNVENPNTEAFSEGDLQFLEIFSRDVAVALNTLELLVAQQANTAQASVEAIHGEVALPVDEILNDAVNVMERYIGHEPEVVERLQRILRNARDIKQVIHKVGEAMTPSEAVVDDSTRTAWPRLRNRRILVVDTDDSVRGAAHNLLERFGCIVETAHEGKEAVLMVRIAGSEAAYDAIIADIRLPDFSGYELLLKLGETLEHVPLILMSGFGYDPGHSIVKARQAGLLPNAVLYKPFRLDQLLTTVDMVIANREELTSTES